MKPALIKTQKNYYYSKNNVKVYGVPDGINGDLSNIIGNLSNISGNVSNISCDLTDISGNIDDCEITEQERKNVINITDLIQTVN